MCLFGTPARMGICIRIPRLKNSKKGIYSKMFKHKGSNWHTNERHIEN